MHQNTIKRLVTEVLRELLNESIHVMVSGYESSEDITTMGDLRWWLGKKVEGPIMKKMTDQEKHTLKSDIITPDGNSYDQDNGIMTVYIGLYPKRWRGPLLGGIQHFLDERGVKYDPWYSDKSKMYSQNGVATDAVRIPITDLNATPDPAPNVSMTYSTANAVFDYLKIGGYFNDHVLNVPVDAVLQGFENLKKDKEIWNGIMADESAQKYFILEMVKTAQWAKSHGFDHLQGS